MVKAFRVTRNKPAKTILEASIDAQVEKTLRKWVRAKMPGVLIGGMAMAFWSKPRYTQDIDVLYSARLLSPNKDFVAPPGFKRHRKSAMEDTDTGVEVELVNASLIGIPESLVDMVAVTSVLKDGVRVATPEGLIALKLYSAESPKRQHQDLGDIVNLLIHNTVDMRGWGLSKRHEEVFQHCLELSKG